MPLSHQRRHLRASLGGKLRHNPEADVDYLRREIARARFEERIRSAVAEAPPLPADLSQRLIELIRSVPNDEAIPA